MKQFVTGGAGFIGSNYVRWVLANTDDEVTVYDALTYAGNLSTLRDVDDDPRYSFVKGNICDPGTLEEAMAGHDAGRPLRGREPRRPLDRRARRLRQHQLLRHQRGHGHGPAAGDPPRHPHRHRRGVRLGRGGLVVRRPTRSSPGRPTRRRRPAPTSSPCRTSRPTGCRSPSPAAPTTSGPTSSPEKAIPLFTTNLIDGGTVPLYGDGLNERDWLYVDDHCAGVGLVLAKGAAGEIYNIGAGNETPNRVLVDKLLAMFEVGEERVDYVTDRLGHDRRYSVDIDKITALGWRGSARSTRRWSETVAWYRANEWWWRPLKERAGLA